MPSIVPSVAPTSSPTVFPSKGPSRVPSEKPSESPSEYPTFNPSEGPSLHPSTNPSSMPSPTPSDYSFTTVHVPFTIFEISFSPIVGSLDDKAIKDLNKILDDFIIRKLVLPTSFHKTVEFSTFILSQYSGRRRANDILDGRKVFSEEHLSMMQEEKQTLIVRFNKTAHFTLRVFRPPNGNGIEYDARLVPGTEVLDFAVLDIFSDNAVNAAFFTTLRSTSSYPQFETLTSVEFLSFVHFYPRSSVIDQKESETTIFFVLVSSSASVFLIMGMNFSWRYRKRHSKGAYVGQKPPADDDSEWDFDNDGVSSIGFDSVVEMMMKEKKVKYDSGSLAASKTPSRAAESPRSRTGNQEASRTPSRAARSSWSKTGNRAATQTPSRAPPSPQSRTGNQVASQTPSRAAGSARSRTGSQAKSQSLSISIAANNTKSSKISQMSNADTMVKNAETSKKQRAGSTSSQKKKSRSQTPAIVSKRTIHSDNEQNKSRHGAKNTDKNGGSKGTTRINQPHISQQTKSRHETKIEDKNGESKSNAKVNKKPDTKQISNRHETQTADSNRGSKGSTRTRQKHDIQQTTSRHETKIDDNYDELRGRKNYEGDESPRKVTRSRSRSERNKNTERSVKHSRRRSRSKRKERRDQ